MSDLKRLLAALARELEKRDDNRVIAKPPEAWHVTVINHGEELPKLPDGRTFAIVGVRPRNG